MNASRSKKRGEKVGENQVRADLSRVDMEGITKTSGISKNCRRNLIGGKLKGGQ